MPRHADARLEGRILDAAYKLWTAGGEHAFNMRAVARAAGTTTPTLYQRFQDKEDLLAFLRNRARQKLFLAVQASRSAAEACRRALQFTVTHPNEYRLMTAEWAVRLGRNERLPAFQFVKELLAVELGGSPNQHTRLALALVALIHGTAVLLLADGVPDRISKQLRRICIAAVESLIRDAAARSKENA